jgi:hypothetical protein
MDISLSRMRRLAARQAPLIVLLACCAFAFLLIVAFGAPPRALGLDPSWTEVLAWGFLNHAQWGRDLIFTYGPLGFLQPYASYVEGIFPWYAAGEIVLPAAFALTIGLLLRRSSLALLGLFALAYVCWCSRLAGDVSWALTLLFGTVYLVSRSDGRATMGWWIAVALLGPAFGAIALAKFSLFPLWALCVAILAAAQVLSGRWRRALLLAGWFALALVVLWLACGQKLSSLPLFIGVSLEIASGYPHAMGDRAPLLYEFLGLALLGLFLLSCVYAAWHQRGDRLALAIVSLVAAAAVLFWLAFFTRGDHWPWFYPAISLLPFAFLFDARFHSLRYLRQALAATVLLAICIEPPPRTIASDASFRVRNGVYNLAHLPQLAAIRKSEWRSVSLAANLPKIRVRVGRARVDMVTLEQGMLLLNGLNYAPRPVFQSYSAYTPYLARLNESYFLGANAPDFVIFRLDYIDGRLPMMEDALALVALLKLYRPVLSERGFLLLRRDRKETADPVQALAGAIPAALGTEVPIGGGGATTLAFIHIDLNAFGRIYTLLFREPALYITQSTASGEKQRHRLVRPTAASGFVVSPMIESNNDWVKLYFSKPMRSVSRIVIDTDTTWERMVFQNDYSLAFAPLQSLHADPATLTSQIGGMLLYPGFNLIPVGTTTFKTVMEDGQESLFMHAPASLDFKPSPGRYAVTGTFGIQRIAVNDAGCIRAKPDGIGVSIVLRHGDNESVLLHNEINPFQVARDAGPQRLSINGVDVAEGDIVTYRVDAGPEGKNVSCDWTYVRDLLFAPSSAAATPALPVNSKPYPGFNLAPRESTLRIVVDEGKESVFLHAPATVSFAPDAGRYRIAATFGLQSIAVSDAGCRKAGADGIGASLVLRHGNRETRLWHGEVDPFRNAADRGPHQADVAAVDVAAGDLVDWRVDPGHGGGNTSCDWSYLRDVVFSRGRAGSPNAVPRKTEAAGGAKNNH